MIRNAVQHSENLRNSLGLNYKSAACRLGSFARGDRQIGLGRQETPPATPLGRVGQTDDVATAAAFFASNDSKWITGETLLIAGGLR
jgi:NAD(P)-dependent dehydrogenase (short-subunit alcohol dehydrogenase family)